MTKSKWKKKEEKKKRGESGRGESGRGESGRGEMKLSKESPKNSEKLHIHFCPTYLHTWYHNNTICQNTTAMPPPKKKEKNVVKMTPSLSCLVTLRTKESWQHDP